MFLTLYSNNKKGSVFQLRLIIHQLPTEPFPLRHRITLQECYNEIIILITIFSY